MRYLPLLAAAAALFASPAFAQSADPAPAGTAPDGTPQRVIEPYFGILGGYDDFSSNNRSAVTRNCNGRSGCPDGGFVEGVAGVNLPIGPVFIGAEGNIAKGFSGIDYEYGGYGRFGLRAGGTGLIYGKVGYQWVRTDERSNGKRRTDNIAYGLGVEVGPKEIGLGGLPVSSGARLRLEVSTVNFEDLRPSAGIIFHF